MPNPAQKPTQAAAFPGTYSSFVAYAVMSAWLWGPGLLPSDLHKSQSQRWLIVGTNAVAVLTWVPLVVNMLMLKSHIHVCVYIEFRSDCPFTVFHDSSLYGFFYGAMKMEPFSGQFFDSWKNGLLNVLFFWSSVVFVASY